MKRLTWLTLLAGLGLVATPAHATTWTIEGKVTKVVLADYANNNAGSTKALEIFFDTTGTVCGTSGLNYIGISSTESATLFEHWVRHAQTAYLSGRTLKAVTSNATGSCKTYYVEVK
jgi:hypothetical protein